MFAINHAATALLIKRRFPGVPLLLALVAVQLVEFLWVALNFAGIEFTETEPVVRYVGDIHLSYMPFSHSVLTTTGLALLAWVLWTLRGQAVVGRALALAVASHLLLDILTHNGDIAIAPFMTGPKLGTYLYGSWPGIAFAVELGYGILCWWVYKGGWALLATIVLFNLANVSLFFGAVPGPEGLFANRPTFLVGVILLQIVVTLALVGVTARVGRGREAAA